MERFLSSCADGTVRITTAVTLMNTSSELQGFTFRVVLLYSAWFQVGYLRWDTNDCWAELKRDSNGRLVPSRSKFPSGIKALADYVHNKGLKLDIYSDAGYYTCQKQSGSLGHEEVDADTFGAWMCGQCHW